MISLSSGQEIGSPLTAQGKLIDVPRLVQTMRQDRLSLQRFRTNRLAMVREYMGANWNDDGTARENPVNMIALYASIMGNNLMPNNPRVLLSTFDTRQKPAVKAMQRWDNDQIIRMNLKDTLQRIVLDGLFSIGIGMVALATPGDAAMSAWKQKAGGVFVGGISLDDFVCDMHANDPREWSYAGHRARVPLEVVRESKMYGKSRKEIEPQYDRPYNIEGDQRLETLGRGIYGPNTQEIEDYVDLWIVHVRRHNVILTIVDDGMSGPKAMQNGEALHEQKWIGPAQGPYHVLRYGTVPDNFMPLSPIMNLVDLHRAANNCFRKLIRQGQRQKSLTFVNGMANEDGSRTMTGNDGDIIKVDNAASISVKDFGGPNQALTQLAQNLKDTFDFMAGGLSLMGGLGPQSKTLGQDKMLNENASHSVKAMQDATVNFTSDILTAMNWYWWYDPQSTMIANEPIGNRSVTTQVTPQMRQGPMPDVACDPYSLQHSTPQIKLAFLNEMVQAVQPMMARLQQQGIFFDVNFWLQKAAEYGDSPDLGQMFTIRTPQPAQGGADQTGGMGAQPETTRNYVRRSVGADTQNNHQADMMNMAAAGAKKNEEANAA